MANCPSLAGCPFYNDKMTDKPALANLYKRNYCEKNYTDCARWKVASALGKQAVPSDLFPNQNDRVEKIKNQIE
ncbi:MAG TPA: hypothetical protein GXZ50_11775 [Clostridia bacterium]|nr:hypothetical protein [Clostridia bacterium]